MIDLNYPWQWFHRIVERGSLTLAAQDLNISVAAISQLLKREEKRLKIALLFRTTRKLSLTPEGRAWYEATLNAQRELEEGLDAIKQNSDCLTGKLRIAAPSQLGRTLLMDWLSEFLLSHPRITPTVQIHDDNDDLVADSVDLALRYGVPEDSGLITRILLADNRRVVCATPAYWKKWGKPNTPEDLVTHRCMAFHIRNKPHVNWVFEKDGLSSRITILPHLLSNDGAIVTHWAHENLGVMYRSQVDVQADLNSGTLEAVLTDWTGERCPLYMARPGNRLWPIRGQAFWDFCIEKTKNMQ